ncbi:MAG: CDP-diacylglycerol--serine O-phosphatidyltransferase [Geminicoccaceae bacterium]
MKLRRGQKLDAYQVWHLIPNILTIMGLCAGLTGIRYGLDGRFQLAAGLIVLAGVLDGLDGRSARLLKITSKLGAQLDSLADFLSFGVAPAFLIYLWSLNAVHGVGWALVLLFTTCQALRLARFNIESDKDDKPAWTRHFFTGVPAPAAAGCVLLPMMLWFGTGFDWLSNWFLNATVTALIAVLMVSRLPTVSFKRIRLNEDYILPALVGSALLVAFLAAEFWLTMSAVGLTYIASLPIGWLVARRLRRRQAEAQGTDQSGRLIAIDRKD